MKATQTRRILSITALAAASILPMAGQSRPTPGSGTASPGGGNRLDYLAGYLSLTGAQKTQAQAIFDAASTAAETARGTMDSARTALTTAIKANASDAELDRLSAAIGTIHAQVTAIEAKAQAKFYALLTADQKAKYDQLLSRSGGGIGGRRFGRM